MSSEHTICNSSVSDPFVSVTLESNPLRPRQFVSQSPIHLHWRLLSKSLSLVFLSLMMLKGGKKLVSSTEPNTWGGLYCTDLVLPLQLIEGSSIFFPQIVISAQQRINVTDFHFWWSYTNICHFCLNGVNLHTYLLYLKAKNFLVCRINTTSYSVQISDKDSCSETNMPICWAPRYSNWFQSYGWLPHYSLHITSQHLMYFW